MTWARRKEDCPDVHVHDSRDGNQEARAAQKIELRVVNDVKGLPQLTKQLHATTPRFFAGEQLLVREEVRRLNM